MLVFVVLHQQLAQAPGPGRADEHAGGREQQGLELEVAAHEALGVGDDLAHTSIRFSLGRFTTEEEIDFAAKKVISTVKKLRELKKAGVFT